MKARNRKERRIAASELRGTITDTTINLSPHIPKDLNIPKGYKLKGQGGMTVETIKNYYVKKRWWWKVRLFFNKNWRPVIKVQVRFV